MQPFFTDYINNLQEHHNEIRTAIKGLSPEALDWMPGAEINSLSVLVTHLSGAERYWIGDVIAGDPKARDREAEFRVKGASEQDLIRRLSDNEAYFQKALEPLALPELEASRISPRNGQSVTVGWVLCYVLKHTALHVGHMQITRQLWEQQQIHSK
jgi:uncharacterized damage-inducible protein DinB